LSNPSSGRSLPNGQLGFANQFLKKSPVMNHCLAQVFSVGLSLSLTNRDFVGRPVICENQWMVHGNIGRSLLKVTHRIAACGHHIAQQLIGLRDRASGAVNEPRLHPGPRLYEARTITWGERLDVQTLYSFCALFEPGFRLPAAAVFLHSAVIFSAKLSAQPSSSAPSEKNPRGDAYNHNHGESND
jgi:hypothetical protein